MKICHKKNFWAGVGMLALGILNLATALWRGQMEWSDWVLVLALVLLAVAVGLAFALTISFFAEFFAALYHESRN